MSIIKHRPPPLPIDIFNTISYTIEPDDHTFHYLCKQYEEPDKLTPKQQDIYDQIMLLKVKYNTITHENCISLDYNVIPGLHVYISDLFCANHYYETVDNTSFVSCVNSADLFESTRNHPVYHYDVVDSPSVSILDKFDEIALWIDNELVDGKKVIIHCFAGINRSVSIALAYYCYKTGKSLLDGFENLIRQKSGILSNTGFIKQLILWADKNNYLNKN